MNAEKKSVLVDFLDSSAYPILFEVIEELVKLEEGKVLKYDLRNGDLNGLLITKCEAEGSRKLAFAIQRELKSLRVAALKA